MKLRIVVLSIFLLVFIPIILSIPPIPTEFYGTATYYDYVNTSLDSGTLVSVYAANISCGNFSIINSGYYGVLTCLGDDNYTGMDEGAEYGQNIIFYLDNQVALTSGDTVWYYGEYHRVDLNPVPRCGNGVCELTEYCLTCAEDCGICPTNISGEGSGGVSSGG